MGTRISPDEIAEAMSKVLSREVRARAIPREQWTASLQAQGMRAGFAAPFEEMEDGFNSGWIDFGVPGANRVAYAVTPSQVFAQAG